MMWFDDEHLNDMLAARRHNRRRLAGDGAN
jgi:hypothetical protein